MADDVGVIISQADGQVIGQSPTARALLGAAQGRTCWAMMKNVPKGQRLPCNEGCVGERACSDDPVTAHTISLRGQTYELRCTPVDGTVVSTLRPEPGETTEWDRLTPREIEVLRLMADGLNGSEIAEKLGIRPGTVRAHVEHMRARLGCHTRAALVAQGFRLRYLE
jgi:DNA-binding CsgD family transcriptional regulator